MPDDTPRMRLMNRRPDPSRHAMCAWPGCPADASDRYPVELCQQHVLHIWSMVDADLRESAKTHEELRREAEEQYLNSHTVKKRMADAEARARTLARDRKRGWVYILEVGGLIKIGHTVDPFRRGGEYPPSSELLAVYPGTRADEKALHERFVGYRVTGREWYMDAQEIRDYIGEIGAAPNRWEKAMFRRPQRGDQAPVRGIREKGHYVV